MPEPGGWAGCRLCGALDTLWPLQEGWELDYRKDKLGRGGSGGGSGDRPSLETHLLGREQDDPIPGDLSRREAWGGAWERCPAEAAGRVPSELATRGAPLASPFLSLQPRLQGLSPLAFLGHLGPETTPALGPAFPGLVLPLPPARQPAPRSLSVS